MARTGVDVRILPRKLRRKASTYVRLPPSTVRHAGRSRSESSPWLSKKRRNGSAGKVSTSPAGVDQIAAAIGST